MDTLSNVQNGIKNSKSVEKVSKERFDYKFFNLPSILIPGGKPVDMPVFP